MGSLLESTINVVTPFLMSMQLVIMETSSASGFIASDNPCCWFDMEIVKGKSHFRSPGIGSPTIEISLPISPKQLIYFTHHRLVMGEMYFNLDVDTSLVKGFNRRTLMYADKLAVSSRSTPMLKSLITK